MTITAALIKPNEPPEVIEIEPDAKTLQDLVAGQIDYIDGPEWSAYLNQEGKLIGQQANPNADRLALALGWVFQPGDFLVGPVVFVGPEHEGVDTSASPEVIELARALSQNEPV